MRNFAGKLVYDALEEIVAAPHTALLVVDMQNDFCSPDGVFGKRGADTAPVRAIIPATRRLLDTARRTGTRPIFLRHTHEPDLSNLSPARLSFYAMLYGGADPYHAIRGTWGHEIVGELAPKEGEIVIDKSRSSGFIATSLDLVLRSNRIETVVITGMATHACVESTARDAGFFDYYAVVVEDCVADYRDDLHRAALLTLGQRVTLSNSEALCKVWLAQSDETPLRATA
jgi:nicotinamidase-related amidase